LKKRNPSDACYLALLSIAFSFAFLQTLSLALSLFLSLSLSLSLSLALSLSPALFRFLPRSFALSLAHSLTYSLCRSDTSAYLAVKIANGHYTKGDDVNNNNPSDSSFNYNNTIKE